MDAATIRFAYYGGQSDLAPWERLFQIVKDKAPQLTITPELLGGGLRPHYQQLLIMHAAGTSPDATAIGSPNIQHFAKFANGLLALDDLARRDRYDLNDFWPQIMGIGRYKSKLYALPLGGAPNGLFWNMRHFRDAALEQATVLESRGDWTWERLADTARRLAVRDGDGYKRAGMLVSFAVQHVGPYLWAAGGDYFNPDRTRCTLAQPPALEAIQFLVDLVQRHRMGPPSQMPGPGISWLPDQTVSMFPNSAANAYGWRQQEPSLEFDVVMYPKSRAGQFGVVDAGFASVTAATKVPDAAWLFLKHLVGPEAITYYASIGRSFPWRKSVAQSADYRKSQPIRSVDVLFRMVDKNGRATPYVPAWGDIEGVANRILLEVGTGQASVREGMGRLTQEVDRLLAA